MDFPKPLDENTSDADYRRRVVQRAILLLEEEVRKRNGLYSGDMVPNFTSLTLLCGVDFVEVLEAVQSSPVLDPDKPLPWGAN